MELLALRAGGELYGVELATVERVAAADEHPDEQARELAGLLGSQPGPGRVWLRLAGMWLRADSVEGSRELEDTALLPIPSHVFTPGGELLLGLVAWDEELMVVLDGRLLAGV